MTNKKKNILLTVTSFFVVASLKISPVLEKKKILVSR